MQIQRKKGQAAMEFLMTYGWAILAAIIAIGVLAYFGVFNPGQFVQDSLIVTAPLNGESFQVLSDGTVNIEVYNGAGESIAINNLTLTPTSPSGATCTQGTGYPYTVPTNTLQVLNATCTGTFTAGDTFRADIVISYNTGGTFDSSTTGSITATIQ